MAVVYLAEQTSLRRQVAFKVLRSGLAHDAASIARFHHEAQAAAALVHANIVQIYEVGCIEGVHFIAQEYVAGRNLRQVLARHGPLDLPQALSVIRQVAAALQKAAERGVVHRDIKPENILLTADGDVKVADFGLARVVSGDQRVDLTQVGITVGTPLYMSPEQLQGRALDSRSDLYSLGVTSYHMLAGRPPFEGETALSLAVQHLQKAPPPLAEFRPDLPASLCNSIHQLLAKLPDDRCESPSRMLSDLKTLDASGVEYSGPIGPPTSGAAAQNTALRNTTMPGTAASRAASAVAQLQSAMLHHRRSKRAIRGWLLVAGGLMAAFAIGAVIARVTRPAPLLRASAATTMIERQPSAAAQYALARQLGTELAYASVGGYFPPEENETNQIYADRAALQLAYLHENDHPEQALALYQQLATQDRDSQLAAFGLVGLANLAHREGNAPLAATHVEALVEYLLRQTVSVPQSRFTDLERWFHRLEPPLRESFRHALRRRIPAASFPNRPPLPRPFGDR